MRQTECKWNLHAAWLKMTLLLVFTKQANDTHVLMEKKNISSRLLHKYIKN